MLAALARTRTNGGVSETPLGGPRRAPSGLAGRFVRPPPLESPHHSWPPKTYRRHARAARAARGEGDARACGARVVREERGGRIRAQAESCCNQPNPGHRWPDLDPACTSSDKLGTKLATAEAISINTGAMPSGVGSRNFISLPWDGSTWDELLGGIITPSAPLSALRHGTTTTWGRPLTNLARAHLAEQLAGVECRDISGGRRASVRRCHWARGACSGPLGICFC